VTTWIRDSYRDVTFLCTVGRHHHPLFEKSSQHLTCLIGGLKVVCLPFVPSVDSDSGSGRLGDSGSGRLGNSGSGRLGNGIGDRDCLVPPAIIVAAGNAG
jgi:hypothetical protein